MADHLTRARGSAAQGREGAFRAVWAGSLAPKEGEGHLESLEGGGL